MFSSLVILAVVHFSYSVNLTHAFLLPPPFLLPRIYNIILLKIYFVKLKFLLLSTIYQELLNLLTSEVERREKKTVPRILT